MEIQEYVKNQTSLFKEIKELDLACKQNQQFIGRYVRKPIGDSIAFYVLVDETPQKYLLRFALGEFVHPDWGSEIKINKKVVEEMILGRDKIETIFPPKN